MRESSRVLGIAGLPLCLNIILPGTTYSEADFLAPSRRPAESLGPLALPWLACDADRENVNVVGNSSLDLKWELKAKLSKV